MHFAFTSSCNYIDSLVSLVERQIYASLFVGNGTWLKIIHRWYTFLLCIRLTLVWRSEAGWISFQILSILIMIIAVYKMRYLRRNEYKLFVGFFDDMEAHFPLDYSLIS